MSEPTANAPTPQASLDPAPRASAPEKSLTYRTVRAAVISGVATLLTLSVFTTIILVAGSRGSKPDGSTTESPSSSGSSLPSRRGRPSSPGASPSATPPAPTNGQSI